MPVQLPPALLASLQTVKGFDEKAFIEVHESGVQITSVRINPGKIFNIQYSIFNDQSEKIPWCSTGYYLTERPSFTADPLFHAGVYYVQEASSMFLEEAIRQTHDLSKPLRVLDLCAAPGGKSTLIQSIVSNDSLLVSNEVIKTRVNILSENMTKWGAANVVVTNNDPKDFQKLQDFFDLIVVDAPCSGSGLFRKDPGAINEWSLSNVELCSQRQQRILTHMLPALKPGGKLIYSTCSYSESEDEEIADWLSGQQLSSIPLQLKDEWNIVETASKKHHAQGYRFYPDKLKGEGFFIAVFQKEGIPDEPPKHASKQKNKLPVLSRIEMDVIKSYLKNPGTLDFFKWNEEIIAIPASLHNDMILLQSSLYIKKAGVKIGAVVRNELLPDHELALSSHIADTVVSLNVDKETALEYLRRAEINTSTILKGWALIKFGDIPLGWVKVLPNRINNYYPKTWRILNK